MCYLSVYVVYLFILLVISELFVRNESVGVWRSCRGLRNLLSIVVSWCGSIGCVGSLP